MSEVLINDGFEMVGQSELNDGKVLFLNYRLTRDIPMGEYSDAVRKIRDSFKDSFYKTVHINVERSGRNPMTPEVKTLSDRQMMSRTFRGYWFQHAGYTGEQIFNIMKARENAPVRRVFYIDSLGEL